MPPASTKRGRRGCLGRGCDGREKVGHLAPRPPVVPQTAPPDDHRCDGSASRHGRGRSHDAGIGSGEPSEEDRVGVGLRDETNVLTPVLA